MSKVRKDEILDRLIFSDALAEAYARPERQRREAACDHWPEPVLLERLAYLRKIAHFSQGEACETLREFPGYRMTLMVLLRSSERIPAPDRAHTYHILEGRATLTIGGRSGGEQTVGTGELGGNLNPDQEVRPLKRGDVTHVTPGTPHQFELTGVTVMSALVTEVEIY